MFDDDNNMVLLCTDSTITLTCEVEDSIVGLPDHYQWFSSLEYETFEEDVETITVEVKSYPVNYLCRVTDTYNTGYANITIVSNGQCECVN